MEEDGGGDLQRMRRAFTSAPVRTNSQGRNTS
jgi:hypothetical protein